MRRLIVGLVAGGLLVSALPVFAQDDGSGEIIVTGMRRISSDSVSPITNVGSAPTFREDPAAVQMLRRTADFAVQQVIVTGDTTDEGERRTEIYAMTKKAIDAAAGAGVQVSTGELVVEPLTIANYKALTVEDNDDDGGEQVKFLVKVPLKPGIDGKAALARIDKFIKAVPAVGRAEIKPYSELTLSVVNPEQYRGAIIDLVAKDASATSARFGAGYGVEVSGLDRPVKWKQASMTEVLLYLPVTSTVRPRD